VQLAEETFSFNEGKSGIELNFDKKKNPGEYSMSNLKEINA